MRISDWSSDVCSSDLKDVLLVERFDRAPKEDDWTRRGVVSALTLLALDETEARYASYEDLATVIRHRFVDPAATLAELYARIIFNILCGNTEDRKSTRLNSSH